MKKFYLISVLCVIGCFIFSACQTRTASLKTFTDPSISTAPIKTVAVFPMRNTAFSPGETLEIDRIITQSFFAKNNLIKIISITESLALLNIENLAAEFADFLEDFEKSGMPNTVFLNKLKTKFDFDAILQGRLSEVHQNDYGMGEKAHSKLTMRYTLLSTSSGAILWEGTSSAFVEYGKSMGRKGKMAPSFIDIGTMAKDKIVSSIPTLGQ